MAPRNVIIELKPTDRLSLNSFVLGNSFLIEELEIPPLKIDRDFEPVPVLDFFQFQDIMNASTQADFNLTSIPDPANYVVRGTIDDSQLSKLDKILEENPDVINIYADVRIRPMVQITSQLIGTDKDVERLLCIEKLHSKGMTGKGVVLAIVDTGINMNHLRKNGKNPDFDLSRSWSPDLSILVPGSLPLNHGTMVAYDACIAAPDCTLLDIAIMPGFGQLRMPALLSNALQGYNHLIDIFIDKMNSGKDGSLVINNSWGLSSLRYDLPIGHYLNYSDSHTHPFTRQVATLESLGADILFAAGNDGPEWPANRRKKGIKKAIYGANSSPFIISVAGININKERLGYSSIGPGRLEDKKPDLCGYTHFTGSGVSSSGDTGTSAACGVVSGVVAAIRTNHPYDPGNATGTNPAFMRQLLKDSAEKIGSPVFDYEHGYGVINPCFAVDKL